MREFQDKYEIFLKICELGSFSKVAESLNYTQSAISQMVAGLEGELVILNGKSKVAVRLDKLGYAHVDMPVGFVEKKKKAPTGAF